MSDRTPIENLFSRQDKESSEGNYYRALHDQTEILQKIYVKVNQLELDFTKARNEDTLQNLKDEQTLKDKMEDKYVSKESLDQRIKSVHIIYGIFAFIISIAATVYKGGA